MQYPLNFKIEYVILLLIAMHIAGVVGMYLPGTTDVFLSMSPLNLLASAFFVFSFHRQWRPAFLITMIVFCLVGYGVEVLGTHYGFPFGQYVYGDALGISAFGVPLIMGLTWALLLYSTAVIAFVLVRETWARVAIASFLMVFIDIWIEPIAGKLDFWHWEGGHAPLINFAGWWVVSMILHSLFFLLGLGQKNKVALLYYPIVCSFFILLNIFL